MSKVLINPNKFTEKISQQHTARRSPLMYFQPIQDLPIRLSCDKIVLLKLSGGKYEN